MFRIGSVAVVCALSLGGCASTYLPEKWSSLDEAFPPRERLRSSEVPSESQQRGIFAAPYEDVYRAAMTSLSQAQYNIGYEDKKSGSLAGTRIVQAPPGPGVGDNAVMPTERRYFVTVSVQERGPKSTEVLVAAKAQGRCQLTPAVAHIITAGASAMMGVNDKCRAYSELHWASGNTSASQDLNSLLNFIRNNLLAAGVL